MVQKALCLPWSGAAGHRVETWGWFWPVVYTSQLMVPKPWHPAGALGGAGAGRTR